MSTATRLLLGGVLIAGLASAQQAAARQETAQQRLENQQARINQGIASGQLTKGEATADEHRDQWIAAQRRRDLAAHGGHLTVAERHNLQQHLNRNSAHIYDTKHNDHVAPPR